MYHLVRYSQPAGVNGYRSAWGNLDQQIDTLLGSVFSDFGAGTTRSIPVNVREDQDNLLVTAELPGVAREDVNVELTDDVLSLTATRKVTGGEAEQTLSFARRFTLPYAVQADKIAAELKDGILRLTLPKAEAIKPRKIAIN